MTEIAYPWPWLTYADPTYARYSSLDQMAVEAIAAATPGDIASTLKVMVRYPDFHSAPSARTNFIATHCGARDMDDASTLASLVMSGLYNPERAHEAVLTARRCRVSTAALDYLHYTQGVSLEDLRETLTSKGGAIDPGRAPLLLLEVKERKRDWWWNPDGDTARRLARRTLTTNPG